jgi:uncharacterized repeat protein (TIGR03803 family)
VNVKIWVLFALASFSSVAFSQDTYKLLYRFDPNKGGQPKSPLTIVDSVGFGSGNAGLYKAQASGLKFGIRNPCCTGALTVDRDLNLYGVGTGCGEGSDPYGDLFEVSTTTNPWQQTDLHVFSGTDGWVNCEQQFPPGPVIFDSSGNLWGTTSSGGPNLCSESGTNGCGVIFELINNQGTWTENVIHAFSGPPNDGDLPYSGPTYDPATGSFYGTTQYGGANDLGTIYRLSPDGNGGWTETVLHSFAGNPTDGALPYAGVTLDGQGNLYGTTSSGTVWELSKNGEIILLVEFANDSFPIAPVTFDLQGNLWGTTFEGGLGEGVLYELTPANGGWKYSVFHTFMGGLDDGAAPVAGLTLDRHGNLYGTTEGGGWGWPHNSFGTIYEVMVGKK